MTKKVVRRWNNRRCRRGRRHGRVHAQLRKNEFSQKHIPFNGLGKWVKPRGSLGRATLFSHAMRSPPEQESPKPQNSAETNFPAQPQSREAFKVGDRVLHKIRGKTQGATIVRINWKTGEAHVKLDKLPEIAVRVELDNLKPDSPSAIRRLQELDGTNTIPNPSPADSCCLPSSVCVPILIACVPFLALLCFYLFVKRQKAPPSEGTEAGPELC